MHMLRIVERVTENVYSRSHSCSFLFHLILYFHYVNNVSFGIMGKNNLMVVPKIDGIGIYCKVNIFARMYYWMQDMISSYAERVNLDLKSPIVCILEASYNHV